MTAKELKQYLNTVPDDYVITYSDGNVRDILIELINIKKGIFNITPKEYDMTDKEIFNHNIFQLTKTLK
jgi:hypothetical protein